MSEQSKQAIMEAQHKFSERCYREDHAALLEFARRSVGQRIRFAADDIANHLGDRAEIFYAHFYDTIPMSKHLYFNNCGCSEI